MAARWLLAGEWEEAPGRGRARPPSPAGLTAERGAVGGLALGLASLWDARPGSEGDASGTFDVPERPEALEPSTSAPAPASDATGAYGPLWTLRAGGELALYDFLGMALEAWALSEGPEGAPHTTAIRASFLAAVTSVLVPPLAGLAGERVRREQASGCVLAAAGTALFALDAGARDASAAAFAPLGAVFSTGDGAVLAAALCWAAFTVRLSALAQRPGARVVGISAARALVSLAFALVWAASEASGGTLDWGSYLDAPVLAPGEGTALPLAVFMFTALGSGALASTLQAYGQRGVGSARAQVVLSTTPLFTTILALALGLPGEGLGPQGVAGGALIVVGSALGSGFLEAADGPAEEKTPTSPTR